MAHACLKLKDEKLEWKYLIVEFYDIMDIHKDNKGSFIYYIQSKKNSLGN